MRRTRSVMRRAKWTGPVGNDIPRTGDVAIAKRSCAKAWKKAGERRSEHVCRTWRDHEEEIGDPCRELQGTCSSAVQQSNRSGSSEKDGMVR